MEVWINNGPAYEAHRIGTVYLQFHAGHIYKILISIKIVYAAGAMFYFKIYIKQHCFLVVHVTFLLKHVLICCQTIGLVRL
jgi:hypothetical protein